MKKIFLSVPYPNYRSALSFVGAPIVSAPETADVLLLTGGGDLDPRRYGMSLGPATDIDAARDARELSLVGDFVASGREIFGICRGLQVVNVFFGGTLYRHIDGHSQLAGRDRLHEIAASGLLRALYGPRCTVNSAHHQSAARLGRGLVVLARAEDGTIEALAHETLPIFAVQWHPERLCGALARPDAADGAALLSALLR